MLLEQRRAKGCETLKTRIWLQFHLYSLSIDNKTTRFLRVQSSLPMRCLTKTVCPSAAAPLPPLVPFYNAQWSTRENFPSVLFFFLNDVHPSFLSSFLCLLISISSNQNTATIRPELCLKSGSASLVAGSQSLPICTTFGRFDVCTSISHNALHFAVAALFFKAELY